MKLFLDTDILIDIALDREPFSEAACRVLDGIQTKRISTFIAWHSISNFYYLVSSKKDDTFSKKFIAELLDFVTIAPTQTQDMKKALTLNLKDFEDAMQVVAALASQCDLILTRNTKDYKQSPIKVQTPQSFLNDQNAF